MHKASNGRSNNARAKRRYVAALLIFGTNGLITSTINLPSPEIVLWRTLLGCAVLLVCAQMLRLAAPRGHDLAFIAASGAAMGISWAFQYEAYKTVGVGFSSLVYCLGPVLVMALTPMVLREKPSAPHIAGLAVVVMGVVLVNGGAVASRASTWGLFCAALTVVAYVIMVMLSKRASESFGVVGVAMQMASACAVSAVACIAGSASGSFTFSIPSTADIPALAALGLVNGGLCCYWYFDSINKLPAATVAVCDYLEPASSLVLSAVFLDERLASAQIIGAALILVGAIGSEACSTFVTKHPHHNTSRK